MKNQNALRELIKLRLLVLICLIICIILMTSNWIGEVFSFVIVLGYLTLAFMLAVLSLTFFEEMRLNK